jgi:hypothetical protein
MFATGAVAAGGTSNGHFMENEKSRLLDAFKGGVSPARFNFARI